MRISDWSSDVCSSDLVEAALSWIDEHGDRDGDGFVEYGRLTDQGLVNQGWKDSHDSVFHADGGIARGPIALAEVQAYVYGAWRAAEAIFTTLGDPDKARAYRTRADDLRERFDAAFRSEEHTSELQSLMRISYAVFCLTKKKNNHTIR